MSAAITPPTPAQPAAPKPVPIWRSRLMGHGLFFLGIALCAAYFLLLGPKVSEANVRVENAIQHFSGGSGDAVAAFHELDDAYASLKRLRFWEGLVFGLSVLSMGLGRAIQAVAAPRP